MGQEDTKGGGIPPRTRGTDRTQGVSTGEGWERVAEGWERVGRGLGEGGRGWERVGRGLGEGGRGLGEGWERVGRGLGEGGRGLGEGWERVGEGWERVGEGGRGWERVGEGCERVGEGGRGERVGEGGRKATSPATWGAGKQCQTTRRRRRDAPERHGAPAGGAGLHRGRGATNMGKRYGQHNWSPSHQQSRQDCHGRGVGGLNRKSNPPPVPARKTQCSGATFRRAVFSAKEVPGAQDLSPRAQTHLPFGCSVVGVMWKPKASLKLSKKIFISWSLHGSWSVVCPNLPLVQWYMH